MRGRQLQHGDAVDHLGLDRHQMLRIDLVGNLEQHAALVGVLALRRVRRPGGITGGDVKRGRVLGLGQHPALDRNGEIEFGQFAAEQRLEFAPKRAVRVERRGLFGRIFLRRTALHEQSLHGIERRQRVVAALELGHLGADAEQLGDEVFELGGERDDQLGLRLAGKFVGRRARRHQPVVQFEIALLERCNKTGVQPDEPVTRIEVAEFEAEAGGETLSHQPYKPSNCRSRRRLRQVGRRPI